MSIFAISIVLTTCNYGLRRQLGWLCEEEEYTVIQCMSEEIGVPQYSYIMPFCTVKSERVSTFIKIQVMSES